MRSYLPEIPREGPGRSVHAVRLLEGRAESLLPDLQRIDEPLSALVGALRGAAGEAQGRAAAEIHALSHRLALGARDDLCALAEARQQAKARLAQLLEAQRAGGAAEQTAAVAARMNALLDQLIERAQAVDARGIAALSEKALSGELQPSFRKVWTWALEVFFGAPASRYHWPEFAAKVLAKDNGRELKRRMVIHNYLQLGNAERLELLEIASLHANVLRARLAHAALNGLLDCLQLVCDYVELHAQYAALRKSGADGEEARLLQEEERKYLEQALQLADCVYGQGAAIEAALGGLEAVFA